MGLGGWMSTYPAYKGVDGNTFAAMYGQHCSVVQNKGSLYRQFKIDLMNFYDIEKVIIYPTSGE